MHFRKSVMILAVVTLIFSIVCSVPVIFACHLPHAFFSPSDDIEAAIHRELQPQNVATSVHCSLFGISNHTLVADLALLARGGREVKLGLDRRQAALRSDHHKDLEAAGVQVRVKPSGYEEHNKYCVIDSQTVIMGSWNWSARAQKQDNSDLIITECPELATKFEENFQSIWARDSPDEERSEDPPTISIPQPDPPAQK